MVRIRISGCGVMPKHGAFKGTNIPGLGSKTWTPPCTPPCDTLEDSQPLDDDEQWQYFEGHLTQCKEKPPKMADVVAVLGEALPPGDEHLLALARAEMAAGATDEGSDTSEDCSYCSPFSPQSDSD